MVGKGLTLIITHMVGRGLTYITHMVWYIVSVWYVTINSEVDSGTQFQ